MIWMMDVPVILIRAELSEENEVEAAEQAGFRVIQKRADVLSCRSGADSQTLVIPRYSALPYYKELEADISALGGRLINTYSEHLYVADMNRWYWDFKDLTPRTWMRTCDVSYDQKGSFVLKGMTNSRKHKWRTHMFAEDRADISRVLGNLLDDVLVSEQGICVREFEPFYAFPGVEGINGLPVTNEHRFFIYGGEILAAGFYWSEHLDVLKTQHPGRVLASPHAWVKENVCPRLRDRIPFVVADVAEHQDGRWRLVELNDGQMSGLSCVDAGLLYGRLFEEVTGVEDGGRSAED